MKSLLYGTQDTEGAIAFYRGMDVFGFLSKSMDLMILPGGQLNRPIASLHNGVYLVRPHREEDIKVAMLCRKYHLPVWIDYDDDLLDVPMSNPASEYYNRQGLRDNIKWLIANADVVTVSTEHLAKRFNEFRKTSPCVPIPNAAHDLFMPMNEELAPRNPIITWRGSNTHQADLETIHSFILKTQEQRPDLEFVFLGAPDHRTLNLFKTKPRVFPSTAITDYLIQLKSLKPMFHIVPLEDNSFNRAKSNIAWLEATFAGAMVIAPKLPEFDLPFAIENEFDIGFAEKHRADFVKESRSFIKENLMLSKVNLMRKSIIESFL
jgi:hypothetical protein